MSSISEPHPLDPLSAKEISLVAKNLKSSFPDEHIIFRAITLSEPPKKSLLTYLEAERRGCLLPRAPPRISLVQFYLNSPADFKELKYDLQNGCIFDKKDLPGIQSYTDTEEMQASEAACLADLAVKREIELLDLPDDAVVCVEPWTYGTDGMNDMGKRIIMCYLFMRLGSHGDSNHYAYPLDLCVEVSGDRKVINILRVPLGEHDRMELASARRVKFDRRKIHHSSEYHPDLQKDRRTTMKPLHVTQPEGPSFSARGNLITWEKWRFRVGFNYREGLVLHDISYDGRSVFYRLSLSEMFVPYGAPSAPWPRKAAFDLGNNGAGINANNLKLGCDCLGHIKYFDGYHHTISGDPVVLPNAICCHEIDDGILWKHTNYRTRNGIVTRSRILVLQTIITVGNYEYIFAFQFTQDAAINYEVRATGIMSTNPIDLGDSVSYGTVVAPGVMAPYHQHIFSLRIDPAIDGHQNSLVVEESHPMPLNDPAIHNPFACGYVTTKTPVDFECPLDTDVTKNRIFKIVNENILNPVTGGPVGYKLVPHYSQMLLADPSSYHAKRSEFTTHAVWVTKHADHELYASGDHTMQSEGGAGIDSWIKSRPSPQSVRNEDIVIWHTFGTTHNPRVEDWPVMPAEKMVVSLKPINFFERNPAIDVAISNQKENKSVLVDGEDGKVCGDGCGQERPRL